MRMVQHPAYEVPRKRLRRALDEHRPGHMIFVIGPSGVGKTTMRRSVMQEMFGDPAQWGRGRIPVIETFAMLPHAAYFSSRALASALLDELHAPSLGWLLAGSNVAASMKEGIKAELADCAATWELLKPKRASESDMWGMFQRSLRARSCKYVSIDQVTALLKNRRDTSPADHSLHLMALAEEAGVMFIMTGVQEAPRLWDVHSELRRRVTAVWVPPYGDRRPADRLPFFQLLKSLGARYPLSRPDLLATMAHDILAASGGVFDEVVGLLNRASRLAQEEGNQRVLKRHIEASYHGDRELAAIWRDIDVFEHAMAAGDVSKRSLLAKTRWQAADSGGGP